MWPNIDAPGHVLQNSQHPDPHLHKVSSVNSHTPEQEKAQGEVVTWPNVDAPWHVLQKTALLRAEEVISLQIE